MLGHSFEVSVYDRLEPSCSWVCSKAPHDGECGKTKLLTLRQGHDIYWLHPGLYPPEITSRMAFKRQTPSVNPAQMGHFVRTGQLTYEDGQLIRFFALGAEIH